MSDATPCPSSADLIWESPLEGFEPNGRDRLLDERGCDVSDTELGVNAIALLSVTRKRLTYHLHSNDRRTYRTFYFIPAVEVLDAR